MTTAQQYLITATVDGESLGVFDSRSGGESSAEITKHRPGGMGPEKTYAALRGTGDVTIGRVHERERDIDRFRQLRTRAGRARMSVTEQPLDEEGIPWGTPTVWTGLLQSVNTGDADSTSNEPRMCELVMSSEDVA